MASRTYGESLKFLLASLSLPYKNFIHWTLSKIAVFAYLLVFACLAALPFVLGMLYIMYEFFQRVGSSRELQQTVGYLLSGLATQDPNGFSKLSPLLSELPSILWVVFLFLLAILGFVFVFSYGMVLFQNVCISYQRGTRLPIRDNAWFSYHHMNGFLWIATYVGLYMIVPFLIPLVGTLAVAAGQYYKIVNVQGMNPLFLWTAIAIVWAVTIAWCVVIAIRYAFALPAFLESNGKLSVKQSLEASKKLTYGKTWKIIGIALVPMILIGVLRMTVSGVLENVLGTDSFILYSVEFFQFDLGKIVDFLLFGEITTMLLIGMHALLKQETDGPVERPDWRG